MKFGKTSTKLGILQIYLIKNVFDIEKVINRKRKEFRDSNTKENIDKLNQELMDVSKIMSENFDMILNRSKDLGKISEMSSNLKDNSKKVK